MTFYLRPHMGLLFTQGNMSLSMTSSRIWTTYFSKSTQKRSIYYAYKQYSTGTYSPHVQKKFLKVHSFEHPYNHGTCELHRHEDSGHLILFDNNSTYKASIYFHGITPTELDGPHSYQEYYRFIQDFKPDLVLLGLGPNDLNKLRNHIMIAQNKLGKSIEFTQIQGIPDGHFFKLIEQADFRQIPIFPFGREHFIEISKTFQSLSKHPIELVRLAKFFLRKSNTTSALQIDKLAPNFYSAFRKDNTRYLAHQISKCLLTSLKNSDSREYVFLNKTIDDAATEKNLFRRILLKSQEKIKTILIPQALKIKNTGQPTTISVVSDTLSFLELQSLVEDFIKKNSISYHEECLRNLEESANLDIFRASQVFVTIPIMLLIYLILTIISLTRRFYYQGKHVSVGGDLLVHSLLDGSDEAVDHKQPQLEKVNHIFGLKNWYRDRSRD